MGSRHSRKTTHVTEVELLRVVKLDLRDRRETMSITGIYPNLKHP